MKKSSRWPVGIASIYIFFVLVLISFVIFSGFERVDLVTEDYYEKEIKYQKQIDRINRAESLSSPVNWNYDKNSQLLKVQFPEELTPQQIEGNILIFRPSDANEDKMIPLNLSPDGSQIVSTRQLKKGFWKLKIYWKIDDSDYYKEGPLVIQ